MTAQTTVGASRAHKTPKPSLVQVATELLRNRILDLSLEPGRRLDDRVLAERYGLSRTPTREAMNRLAAEGLIDIRSNRGAYVAPLDLNHVSEIFDAYILAERMVGFLGRLDQPGLADDLSEIQKRYTRVQAKHDLPQITEQNAAFHSRLAQATRNAFVHAYATRLYNIARRISFFIYLQERDHDGTFARHAKLIDRHHDEIISLVEARDNGALIEKLTEHALLFRDRVTRVLADLHGEDFPVDWH